MQAGVTEARSLLGPTGGLRGGDRGRRDPPVCISHWQWSLVHALPQVMAGHSHMVLAGMGQNQAKQHATTKAVRTTGGAALGTAQPSVAWLHWHSTRASPGLQGSPQSQQVRGISPLKQDQVVTRSCKHRVKTACVF